MSKCKSCGEEIKWIKTPSGKSMPVNMETATVKPSQLGKIVVVTDSGRVVRGDKAEIEELARGTAVMGHISHFATCPFANQHRRG